MESFLTPILYFALLIHVVLIVVCLWRVWQGDNVIDRLMGMELMGTLTLTVLVLMALIQERTIYIDVALGLAALGFVGTIALAKYLANEQMY